MPGALELPIPVIDLSSDQKSAAKALRAACTEHGFFFVTNHGVPDKVIKAQFQQSKDFFALPEDVKLQTQAVENRGFTPVGEQTLDPGKQKRGDTKESYYICKPEAPEGSEKAKLPFHGPNQWPTAVPGFKPAMEDYMNHMNTTYRKVLNLINEALELPEGYLDPFFVDPILTLRPIHYTAEVSDVQDGVFGAGAHTDWGFITFVETNNTPGLEVFYKDRWIPVPCLPNTFVVNIGDLLQRWSNGVFKSTLHRVVNKTPGLERYSCAYFVSPKYDALIECLPTCAGDGPKFPPTSCAEYLTSKYKATHSNFTK